MEGVPKKALHILRKLILIHNIVFASFCAFLANLSTFCRWKKIHFPLEILNDRKFTFNKEITEQLRLAGTPGDIWSRSPFKQVHQEQVVQDQVHIGFEDLQRPPQPLWATHDSAVPVTLKKRFLMLRGNFLWFSLCPLLFFLPVGTTEESLTLFPLHCNFSSDIHRH